MPRNPMTHPLAGVTLIAAVLFTLGLALLQGTEPVRAQQGALTERPEDPHQPLVGTPLTTAFCVGNRCDGRTCDEVNARCVGDVTLQPASGEPLVGLTADQLARFEAGAAAFNTNLSVDDGLGPIFNQRSCGNCHSRPLGGTSSITVNRFGFIDTTTFEFDGLAELGGSLQQIDAISTECRESIPFPPANVVAQRLTPSTLGDGLVEAIADEDILLNELNPPSVDVSGRAHMVPLLESPGEIRVGRFGWKAQVATVLSFSGDAALNEMGLTNRLVPEENAPNGDMALLALCDTIPDPEDAPDAEGVDFVDRVTDFQRFLAPPPQTPRSGMTGEALFLDIGCASCHTPNFTTAAATDDEGSDEGSDEDDDALFAGKTVAPYSDFLLHDMGFGADFIAQGDAGIQELRTPPLWGMRDRDPMWHDGRVAGGNLGFRVRFPGGVIDQHDQFGSEAQPSAQAFRALSDEEQDAIVDFLGSLGRREFDMNGDGDVDDSDAQAVMDCFTGSGAFYTPDDACSIADPDQDGDVDERDLELLGVALMLPGEDVDDEDSDEADDGPGPTDASVSDTLQEDGLDDADGVRSAFDEDDAPTTQSGASVASEQEDADRAGQALRPSEREKVQRRRTGSRR